MEEPEFSGIRRDYPNRAVRWGKFALQIAILCLVTWGLWGTIDQARHQLREVGVSIWMIHPGWLTLSGLLYLLAMFPSALFWHRVMEALQQKIPKWEGVGAFFVSQLGKYVPGKIMVLVLRYALIRHHQVSRTLTVASIFVDTLTMMSVGAVMGAVMLAFAVATDWRLLAFSVLVSACVGAPTLPPVFLRVVKWTKLHRLHPEIDRYLAGLNWHILWPGWIAIALGWIAMALSLWAALQALPEMNFTVRLPSDLPILIACVTLSTVAGFVSGLPGGIGAREWVVIQLVQPQFGASAAVLSAIVHRVVMVLAELALAGIILAISRRGGRLEGMRPEA